MSSSKRQIARDSEELSQHLSAVRMCLLSFKDELYQTIASPLPEDDASVNSQASNRLRRTAALMDSSSRLFRCCLHMYNVFEDGLNYLDEPDRSIPEVRATQRSAADAMDMIDTALPLFGAGTAEGTVVASFKEPLKNLHNTLGVMIEEMENPPTDPAMLPKQHSANQGGVRARRY